MAFGEGGAGLETSIAVASEAAHRVDAAAVGAQARLRKAFILIWMWEGQGSEKGRLVVSPELSP